MPPPRVLLIARTLPWHIRGGLEQHAWMLSKALRRQGCDVTVYTTSFDDVRRESVRDGVRIVELVHLPHDRKRIPQWRWWFGFAAACAREFESAGEHHDLLLSEMMHGRDVFAHPKAKDATKVYVLHGSAAQDYERATRAEVVQRHGRLHPRSIGQWLFVRRQVRRERRLQYPLADHVVAVSEFVASYLRRVYRVPDTKLHIIGNGVEPPSPLPGREQARSALGLPPGPLVAFLGRLEPAKGPQRLVDLVATGPAWKLVVAGTGSLASALEEAARRQAGTVTFLGGVDDIAKWQLLRAADVVALPSQTEGEPIVILEALAAGTPVATTERWITPEVEAAVAIDASPAQAIERAFALRDEAERLAPRLRLHRTWDAIARKFLELAKR